MIQSQRELRLAAVAALSAVVLGGSVANAQFFEGFDFGLPGAESGAPPGFSVTLASGEWHVLNLSNPIGLTSVFQGQAFVFSAHEGPANSYAGMNFFSGGAAPAQIATYFMSPTTTFRNGDTIGFWTRTTDNPATFVDRLRLLLSLSGDSTDAADFTIELLSVNPDLTPTGYPAEWTNFTATISGLAAPTTGRFAFMYDVPNGGFGGTNSNIVGIDSVSFVPAPAAAALLALAGLVGRRRRSV